MALERVTGLSPAEQWIGGKYKVLRVLGRGGMGTVYEAENTWTTRRVALKVLRREATTDPEAARRFRQEAQAAARLGHPNIVEVLDMGEDPRLGAPYIVQEYLSGRDLARHLRAVGRLSPSDALSVILPVMEALMAAHAQGIVHRDLKPENIFLAETPRGIVPKVIDFGIAKVTADDAPRTLTGVLLGTLFYMSPEQAAGDTTLDARTDVWSLGVVLYELLSGRRPYPSAGVDVLLTMLAGEAPTPLSEVAPELPPDLASVVMGALVHDRARRYPTMASFHAALLGWGQEAGVVPATSHAPTGALSGHEPSPERGAPEGNTVHELVVLKRSKVTPSSGVLAEGEPAAGEPSVRELQASSGVRSMPVSAEGMDLLRPTDAPPGPRSELVSTPPVELPVHRVEVKGLVAVAAVVTLAAALAVLLRGGSRVPTSTAIERPVAVRVHREPVRVVTSERPAPVVVSPPAVSREATSAPVVERPRPRVRAPWRPPPRSAVPQETWIHPE